MKEKYPLIRQRNYKPDFVYNEKTGNGVNCTFTIIDAPEDNIYKYLGSSVTVYETSKLNNEMGKIKIPLTNKNLTMRRTRTEKEYFYEDNTFPLYRGLYCLRDSYTGSNSVKKQVTTQELNLYGTYIQLVYLYDRSGKVYNEEEVRSLYNYMEWNILLPELLTALCLNVISDIELERLIELLERDPLVKSDLKYIKSLEKLSKNRMVRISPPTEHGSEVLLNNATLKSILYHQVCHFLLPVIHQVKEVFYQNNNMINMKAESDFRFIFELDSTYSNLKIKLKTNNGKGDEQYIDIESSNIVENVEHIRDILKVRKEKI